MVDPMVFAGLSDPPLLNNLTEEEYLDKIIKVCCKYFKVSETQAITGKITPNKPSDKQLSFCKKIISYYICKNGIPVKLLERTYPANRGLDHSTICLNNKKISGWLEVGDKEINRFVNDINDLL